MHKPLLSKRLAVERKKIIFRQLLRYSSITLLFFSLSLLFLSFFEKAFIFSEQLSFFILLALFLPSSLLFAFVFYHKSKRFSSIKQLALNIEAAYPELLDRLICSVELENKTAQMTILEKELLAETQQLYSQESAFFPSFFTSLYTLKKTIFCFFSALLLLFAASHLSFLRKANYYFHDLLAGDCSGIELLLPAKEAAMHSDFNIQATIKRWENSAAIEIKPISQAAYQQNMYLRDSGNFSFTYYDLTEKLRFRIVTPSLKSAWQELPVFRAPAADEILITTIPLPYTRNEVQFFTDLQDFTITEGESFKIDLKLPENITAQLSDEEKILQSSKGETIQVKVEKTKSYKLQLQDNDGHQQEYQPFTVTAEVDLPPVIDVQEPAEDSSIKTGDSVLLNVFARDDFGLSELSLLYSISGRERQKMSLYQEENPELQSEKEFEYKDFWKLEEMPLADGDIISCIIIAYDNKQPEPQSSRSELFFITVKPDINEQEADGDSGQTEKKMDISDLLAESKRLLRFTWDILTEKDFKTEEEIKRDSFELLRDIKELEVEVRRRLNKLIEEEGGMVPEFIQDLFRQSSSFLKRASALIEKELHEESIQPQELSLAALVKLENELLKNAMKSKKASSDDDSEGEADEEQTTEEATSSEQQKQQIAEMKEAMQDLEKLLKRQEQLNSNSSSERKLPAELAENQQNIASDTQSLTEKLNELPDMQNATESLQSAISEMEAAKNVFDKADIQAGNIHGQRAHRQLMQARQDLQEQLRKMSANQIAQLADKAAELSQKQSELADKAEDFAQNNVSNEEKKQLRDEQKNVQQESENLQQEAQQLASNLESEYPEVSQELLNAIRKAEQRGLSSRQKRAANALLYGQYEAASKEQKDAANLLQALAQELQQSADSLPAISSEELREMLAKLQELAQNLADSESISAEDKRSQRQKQVKDEAAKMLDEAAEALQNQMLQDISDSLRLPQDSEEISASTGEYSLKLFSAAAAILQQELSQLLLQNKMNFSRDTVLPPKKYKRLVEQYFKELSNE